MAPLISVKDVSLSFGTTPLFESLTFVIEPDARTILIGPNGAGKSTLFKLLNGTLTPDEGEISLRTGIRIATVQQQDAIDPLLTVREYLENSLGPDHPDLHRRIPRYLGTLGMADPDAAIGTLSGGWRKRTAIGAALIQEPDLLLLDEPTNHLDIPSIIWLEQLLQTLPYAIVCISHDRYFIERLATRVVEVDRTYPKGYLSCEGSYSDFMETREQFRSQRESYRSSLANKVRREVEWLRQGVKARGTKSKARIDSANSMIAELGTIKLRPDVARIEITDAGRRAKEFIVVKDASLEIGSAQIVSRLSLVLSPGIRLGISGANGTGKTSLIRLITGELPPSKGSVRVATNLRIAYLDQMRSFANPSLPLKEVLCPEGDSLVIRGQQVHIASWGRRFLFTQNHLSTPFGSLSGGEKARALLACLLAQPADILVLDEPTNDLDIPTREVLEDALSEFTGCVVLVTHDRFMLDAVCTELVGLTGDGTVTKCADYSQWEGILARYVKETANNHSKPPSPQHRIASKKEKSQGLTYGERIELNGMMKSISEAELKVKNLQEEIASGSHIQSQQWMVDKCSLLAAQENEVQRLYDRWEALESKKSPTSDL